MESHHLISNNNVEISPESRRPRLLWSVFMWTLGLVEWRNPVADGRKVRVLIERTKLQRRVMFISSMSFLLILMASCMFTVGWYLLCLFGENPHFLRFGSFSLFYWPIVTSAPAICLFAMIKNHATRNDRRTLDLRWTKIFSESSFANRCTHLENQTSGYKPYRAYCFAFFFSFAALNSIMELIHLVQISQDCQQWPWFICLISHVCILFFYATFCYFLYLNRSIVEQEGQTTISLIERYSSSETKCKLTIAEFFGNYIRLRRFAFPWLNIVIFCTTFGMAIYFTLDRRHIKKNTFQLNITETHPAVQPNILQDIGKICRVPCGQNSTSSSDPDVVAFVLFDVMILCEKVMVVTLALLVVGAMDLNYIWNRFKMHLNLLPVDKVKNRDTFVEYVRHMQPDPTSATIASFVIPILGIACGALSGHRLQLEN